MILPNSVLSIFEIEIPDTISGNWYSGQVYVGIKDATFEPSSPIRHATEVYKLLVNRLPCMSPCPFYVY